MKYLFTILVILLCTDINAQDHKKKNKEIFIRIYNNDGDKIAKGKLQHVADTYILLMKNDKRIEVPPNNIDIIKTKHSVGHSILVHASIGAGVFGLVGAATANPDALGGYSSGEGALIFGTFGALGGTIAGTIFGVAKRKKVFIINGDTKKYNEFKTAMGF